MDLFQVIFVPTHVLPVIQTARVLVILVSPLPQPSQRNTSIKINVWLLAPRVCTQIPPISAKLALVYAGHVQVQTLAPVVQPWEATLTCLMGGVTKLVQMDISLIVGNAHSATQIVKLALDHQLNVLLVM